MSSTEKDRSESPDHDAAVLRIVSTIRIELG